MSYSQDFKKRVIEIMTRDQMSIRSAATHFSLSTNTVLRWTKTIEKKPIPGRPRQFTDEALLKDIQQYPDAYQYERAQRFGCSQSAIFYALKRLGISRKKDFKTSKSR